MSDGKFFIFDFGADIKISNSDIVPDEGIYTAVIISLFSDRRAPVDAALPDASEGRRGWWADTDKVKVGSLLWLLDREKTLPEVAARAREYCAEALQWLIDDGIAAAVKIDATIIRPNGLQILIKISRGKAKKYDYLWQGVAKSEQITAGNTTVQLQFEQ